MGLFTIIWLICFGVAITNCEHVRKLEVAEGVEIGHQIGFVGEFLHGVDSGPPYLIVPVPGSAVDTDLFIDHTTGEIRTKELLDRETRSSYSLVAIPLSGENIRVVIQVLDENDNAPTFPVPFMNVEFPENTSRDVKRSLQPARDLDLGRFNTQRYDIISGNVNNVFRLSSHRELDGVLYLDLVVNGYLDRETISSYNLLIEAMDGGAPPLKGQLIVNVTVQDINDNQPMFNQSRYYATIEENTAVDTEVIQVFAKDIDIGENGLVEYSINRRKSDKDEIFRIDSMSGVIYVNKQLDFETKELHELVVVAKDHGVQSLETITFVSIRVTDINDNQPVINVIFLSDNATPKVSESAQPGEFVARISVNDPDSKTDFSNVNVTLTGGEGHFGLTTRDNIIYLVVVSTPLDRETQSNYTLNVIATDHGAPPLHAIRVINLLVTDVNDNAPTFDQSVYHTSVMEVSDPGTSVVQVIAYDRDDGNNSVISYSLLDTVNSHTQWFQIDEHTGLITTRMRVDCEVESVPQLKVLAKDNGIPSLSSTATVLVTIFDINDNEPIFDQSYYNITISENEAKGHCFLKVSASDPDCGVNAIVNYTIGEDFKNLKEFDVRSSTGEICVSAELDYETRNSYEFSILAVDRGGLNTSTMIKIQLTDVNDNRPIFFPRVYNVSLKESTIDDTDAPILKVAAYDLDSDRFNTITYRITAGNNAGIFRLDRNSGDITLARPNMLSYRSQPLHKINISASDGNGLRTLQEAEVYINIIDGNQHAPVFERSQYRYSVKEDIQRGTVIGTVLAIIPDQGSHNAVRYSIHSGDPDGFLNIDPGSGNIRIASSLDYEKKSKIFLNILAIIEEPKAQAYAQVIIEIEDVNDNSPIFDLSTVHISLREDLVMNKVFYVASAIDKDQGKNGQVTYKISHVSELLHMKSFESYEKFSSRGMPTPAPISNKNYIFAINSKTGHLTLTRTLDFEQIQRYVIIVTATDAGSQPLTSNLTILIEVQDVNDNPPVFEKSEYMIKVIESLPVNSQVLQVAAIDLDTGNNARLHYRIVGEVSIKNKVSQSQLINGDMIVSQHNKGNDELKNAIDDGGIVFGIYPNSGWIYLRSTLDRETCERYELTVIASDNGIPSMKTTTRIIVNVLDANDNDPRFSIDSYDFTVEENQNRGTFVGILTATDADLNTNAVISYSLIPNNTSFMVDSLTGKITTREPLDRELQPVYELLAEARDHGNPQRSTRVQLRITVTDVNDNAPEIIDPQEDVVSVREQQPVGIEVIRVRAIDKDNGNNSTITYTIIKGRDSDGFGLFAIDPISGIVTSRVSLNHEERNIYRLAIAATDNGIPPKQTVRLLRLEVLNINDNRPTFTSISRSFKIQENVPVGFNVGSIRPSQENVLNTRISAMYTTYTLNVLSKDYLDGAFEIDHSTGILVVARKLDREMQDEYRLEVRSLDTSILNNPQSAAITIKIEVIDVNDNAPLWPSDPITIRVMEDTPAGSHLYSFNATDVDYGLNGVIHYKIIKQSPIQTNSIFILDPLTGDLTLNGTVDFETVDEYILIIEAQDQSMNLTERLSSTLTVKIILLDVNDNAPVFVTPNSDGTEVILNESDLNGRNIIHILATDKDADENGRISYSIVSGNEGGFFSLDSNNGRLEILKPLSIIRSNEKQPESNLITFNLIIKASDHGMPIRKESETNLKIRVKGSTSSSPRFLQSVYHVNITENTPLNSFVIRVGAKSLQPENANNLTYEIPAGVDNNHFSIDPIRGIVTTNNHFDREQKDFYIIPVYVMDATNQRKRNQRERAIDKGIGTIVGNSYFDVAMIHVKVLDVNDHAPKFNPGSCYQLTIPENNEEAIVHTVVAIDLDDGPNSDIFYTITGGNVGNKFSIDMHTGELTARPLDRETNSRYQLQITAQDHGTPNQLYSICNISVVVDDQNDNAPRFELSEYTATISEDVPIGTSVMTIQAMDSDFGLNGQVTYSLANETYSVFNIDNQNGLLMTAGLFDREKVPFYEFLVIATDGGLNEARSHTVRVLITIDDVNDNRPIFEMYPFRAIVPLTIKTGQMILQITASDLDQGNNAAITYALVNDPTNGKLRLNPNNGALIATQSLGTEFGQIIQLDVIAKDKGYNQLESVGLIELQIGDVDPTVPSLKFKNESYHIQIPENTHNGQVIMQLGAVRSDGRRQKIQYSIGYGNSMNIFKIMPDIGEIRVANSNYLDNEMFPNGIKLVVVAKAEGTNILPAYTTVNVKLIDVNDNAPYFTQQKYTAIVSEDMNKSTYVMQVQAFDEDQGSNSKITYHIVDGNLDNAFVIEPVTSGIVRTNIVLDREIRDLYKIKVIAVDEGVPQMTGTTSIYIRVTDVNDNQPRFPKQSIINLSEDTEVGRAFTVISANDIDTSPPLIYVFDETNADSEVFNVFTIDRFSGTISLKRPIDYEKREEYQMKVIVSDSVHRAFTTLTVRVIDVNDNAPVFSQTTYHASLPAHVTNANYDLLAVNATDLDSNLNGKISYSLMEKSSIAFGINAETGVINVNMTRLALPLRDDIYLTVEAKDFGTPSLSSQAIVKVLVSPSGSQRVHINQHHHRVVISEATIKGATVFKITPDLLSGNAETTDRQFGITSGNEDGIFEYSSTENAIILAGNLDRELLDHYNLRLSILTESDTRNGFVIQNEQLLNSSSINVLVIVEDANDNTPVLIDMNYNITISELLPTKTNITQIYATDADLPNSYNSEVIYDITSGNNNEAFAIDSSTGVLTVNNKLDYDEGLRKYNLILRACDRGHIPRCALKSMIINLTDENDNAPQFPISKYIDFIAENEPVGYNIFTAHAEDMDHSKFGILNYSILSNYDSTDYNFFKIDPTTGIVSSKEIFDYEQKNEYEFKIQATDVGGKSSAIGVHIFIESRDEFTPQFNEKTYRFLMTASIHGQFPVGHIIGYVSATDRDKGSDGRIMYQLNNQHPYFKINQTSGAVVVKKKINSMSNVFESGSDISLVVTASTGKQGSLSNMAVIEIGLDPASDLNLATSVDNNTTGGISGWSLGLLISFMILMCGLAASFLFMHLKKKPHPKQITKPSLSAENVVNTNNYVDASSFDTIPIRNNPNRLNDNNQFGPPKYDEIPPYGSHGSNSNGPTSDLSGSENSGSSGHGSAEDDGDDEEIRMINERPMQMEPNLHDVDGRMSDTSVQNTQEYLARLGIVDNNMFGQARSAASNSSRRCSQSIGISSAKDGMMHHSMPLDPIHIFDDEPIESDLTNLIYAKLNDVVGSDRGSNSDGGAGTTIGSISAVVDNVILAGFGDSSVNSNVNIGPSMTGSLSSIVHSEEELTGSYNWDYLLDWGPQYQPLAHVFSEIARLKDDTISVQSAHSANSSAKSKISFHSVPKHIPPPLITNIAPRSINGPSISSRNNNLGAISGYSTMNQMNSYKLPRSPINHDGANGFCTSSAMSPNFSPSLSPLATRPLSISPHGLHPVTHRMLRPNQHQPMQRNSMESDMRR